MGSWYSGTIRFFRDKVDLGPSFAVSLSSGLKSVTTSEAPGKLGASPRGDHGWSQSLTPDSSIFLPALEV